MPVIHAYILVYPIYTNILHYYTMIQPHYCMNEWFNSGWTCWWSSYNGYTGFLPLSNYNYHLKRSFWGSPCTLEDDLFPNLRVQEQNSSNHLLFLHVPLFSIYPSPFCKHSYGNYRTVMLRLQKSFPEIYAFTLIVL